MDCLEDPLWKETAVINSPLGGIEELPDLYTVTSSVLHRISRPQAQIPIFDHRYQPSSAFQEVIRKSQNRPLDVVKTASTSRRPETLGLKDTSKSTATFRHQYRA